MRISYKNSGFALLMAYLILTCAGCATVRCPVPKDMITRVKIDDMSDVRTFIGMPNPVMQKNLLEALSRDDPSEYHLDADGNKVYPVLAISGGSANGAYGAGLLKGWSDNGTRPKFKAITGISTGSIIAPMVFLGKDYDRLMEELYTTLSTKHVLSINLPIQALFSNSIASNKPLERQINKFITKDIIDKIAKEHKNGRRLLIGTTLLDSQDLAVWDMGAIAVRGDTELFRKIILASAAIPAVFPPVIMRVKADGKIYDEMHVDGGAISQTFTLYKVLEGIEGMAKERNIDMSKIKANYYIIRNGYVEAGYSPVKNDFVSILGQSFDTMINNQGIGDIYKIYTYAREKGNDYNLAFIPGDFRPQAKEMFDPDQMKKLFDRGYRDAVKGYKWHKKPPELSLDGTL